MTLQEKIQKKAEEYRERGSIHLPKDISLLVASRLHLVQNIQCKKKRKKKRKIEDE